MKNWLVVALCGMLSSTVAFAATNNDSKDEKAVMATLETMAQATIKKDIATLDKIYHPELTYSHSSALLQDKAEVLKALNGKGVTESMTFHDTTIRIFGNTALVRGGNELRNGTPFAMFKLRTMYLNSENRLAGRGTKELDEQLQRYGRIADDSRVAGPFAGLTYWRGAPGTAGSVAPIAPEARVLRSRKYGDSSPSTIDGSSMYIRWNS